jgi:RNA-directed DNA polymerase
MQESHREGPASHPDPEPCVDGRKAGGEALAGAHAGQPSSCEIRSSGVPTPLSEAEGHTEGGAIGEPPSDPAQSKTLHTRGNSSRGNREIPAPSILWVDRLEKAASRTSGMHGVGKSDDLIVPGKQANKGKRPAEPVEGRGSAKGNTPLGAVCRTQSRIQALSCVRRVRDAASAASPPSTRGGSRMR